MTRFGGWQRALACTRAALDHKAYDLVVLETGHVSSIADYFVICTATSDRQSQAVADAIEERMKSLHRSPVSVEGRVSGRSRSRVCRTRSGC